MIDFLWRKLEKAWKVGGTVRGSAGLGLPVWDGIWMGAAHTPLADMPMRRRRLELRGFPSLDEVLTFSPNSSYLDRVRRGEGGRIGMYQSLKLRDTEIPF